MTGHLATLPGTTTALARLFGDAATISAALGFEAALARAQAAVGLIAPEAADRIAEACATLAIDPEQLAEQAALAGTLAIPLVARLREALDPETAALVHRGATSQDLADTVLMLRAARAAPLVYADLDRCAEALARLAARHAATPAMGRTLLQDAVPITFGLRAAQWLAGIRSAAERLERECETGLILQFGGAAGTRAGLDGKGAMVAAHLARALGLRNPPAPWHARRDNVAAIASALAIAIGTLGKVARDVSLLAQDAVGEAHEPRMPGRGGSSAMPHKRNPTGCQVALAAALRAPGLVAGILAGLPQEFERGLGGWQAEAPMLVELFLLAGGSAAAMAQVLEGLEVDMAALARNIETKLIDGDTGEAEALVAAILAEWERR